MTTFTKDTFFEDFFTDNKKPTPDKELDEDMGKRTLTFGNVNKLNEDCPPYNEAIITSDSSISSDGFVDVNESDTGENEEIKELLKPEEITKDTNILFDWKYSTDNIKKNEWEFAYKILNRMKLKEHWVKTSYQWDNTGLSSPNDFTNTLNNAIVYGLVTLIHPVKLTPEVYKIVCKIPQKEARKMYKLNLNIPSQDWILRSKWSWLTCIPYDEEEIVPFHHTNEAQV